VGVRLPSDHKQLEVSVDFLSALLPWLMRFDVPFYDDAGSVTLDRTVYPVPFGKVADFSTNSAKLQQMQIHLREVYSQSTQVVLIKHLSNQVKLLQMEI
jgi:hypothetical protein